MRGLWVASFRVCGDGGGNRLYDALNEKERRDHVETLTSHEPGGILQANANLKTEFRFPMQSVEILTLFAVMSGHTIAS